MEHDEAKALLTSYLNRRMRVVISDGRVMDGQFLCTDSDRNMVLGSCEEFFSEEEIGEAFHVTRLYTPPGDEIVEGQIYCDVFVPQRSWSRVRCVQPAAGSLGHWVW